MRGITIALACMTAFAAASTEAGAQAQQRADPGVRPELRLDYLASPDAVHAGAGAAVRMGTYLRLAMLAAGGPHLGDLPDRFGWRADLVARFQLDPFRERTWGPYAAAGLGVRGAGAQVQEALLVSIGLEGPYVGGWTPAVEIGLGGGARLGLVARRSSQRYR